METSAKTGQNVSEVFVAIGKFLFCCFVSLQMLFQPFLPQMTANKLPKSETPKSKPEIDVSKPEDATKKKGPCCQ